MGRLKPLEDIFVPFRYISQVETKMKGEVKVKASGQECPLHTGLPRLLCRLPTLRAARERLRGLRFSLLRSASA
jgi:hypothetical protein